MYSTENSNSLTVPICVYIIIVDLFNAVHDKKRTNVNFERAGNSNRRCVLIFYTSIHNFMQIRCVVHRVTVNDVNFFRIFDKRVVCTKYNNAV